MCSASSLETSFCVAHGRAMSYSTSCHGRTPAMCLSLEPEYSSSALRLTLSAAMAWTSSGVMPSLDTTAPLESDSETTVAPSSIALSAAYWATLPEPVIATRLPLNVSSSGRPAPSVPEAV